MTNEIWLIPLALVLLSPSIAKVTYYFYMKKKEAIRSYTEQR